MSDSTDDSSKKPWLFKPGQSGNPAGRQKGSRNKFSEAFLTDMLLDWQEGGAETIKRVRQEDPSTYLRVAASILPKEFNINDNDAAFDRFIENLDDKQLDQLIAGLCALGSSGKGVEDKAQARAGSRPDMLH